MSEPVFEDIKENVENLEKILNKTKLSPNELRKALEPFQNNDITGFSALNLGSLNSYFGINEIKSMISKAKALLIMLEVDEDRENTGLAKQRKIDNALDKEKHLDYVEADSSMGKLEKLIKRRNAGEVTSEEFEEMKKEILERKPQISKEPVEVAQKEISGKYDSIWSGLLHGDDVPKKENKDSVISKSNVGAGGDDKFTKLKELTEMKEKGLIDDADYEKMKREIIG